MSKIQEVTPATLDRPLPVSVYVARGPEEAEIVASRWMDYLRTRTYYRTIRVDNLFIPLWIVIQDRKEQP